MDKFYSTPEIAPSFLRALFCPSLGNPFCVRCCSSLGNPFLSTILTILYISLRKALFSHRYISQQIPNMSSQQPNRFPIIRRKLSIKMPAHCGYCRRDRRLCFRALMRDRVRSWYDELQAALTTDEEVYDALRNRVMDAGPNYFAREYGMAREWPEGPLPHCVERLLGEYAPDRNRQPQQRVAVAAGAGVVHRAPVGTNVTIPRVDNDGVSVDADEEELSTRSSSSS